MKHEVQVFGCKFVKHLMKSNVFVKQGRRKQSKLWLCCCRKADNNIEP
jgi:hypothetical protein